MVEFGAAGCDTFACCSLDILKAPALGYISNRIAAAQIWLQNCLDRDGRISSSIEWSSLAPDHMSPHMNFALVTLQIARLRYITSLHRLQHCEVTVAQQQHRMIEFGARCDLGACCSIDILKAAAGQSLAHRPVRATRRKDGLSVRGLPPLVWFSRGDHLASGFEGRSNLSRLGVLRLRS